MPIPTPAAQIARGFAMGAADIVPGVSGGTVALVLGIYERLIDNIHSGAQALRELVRWRWADFVDAVKRVEWVWLISLLGGVLAAVAVLSSVLEDLLHDEAVRMAGLFFGLVSGSVIVAYRMIKRIGIAEIALMLAVAISLFLLLGLRDETEAFGEEIVTEPIWMFFLAGAVAVCAMILPGISGSFILVMIGMYSEVLGAVNDRDMGPLLMLMAGCVVGLALFSTLLHWLLEHYHDLLMASMVGLMLGSLRVLWPWPNGTNTTEIAAPKGDVAGPVMLMVAGFVVVLGAEYFAGRRAAASS